MIVDMVWIVVEGATAAAIRAVVWQKERLDIGKWWIKMLENRLGNHGNDRKGSRKEDSGHC